jgi:hypothetical protein
VIEKTPPVDGQIPVQRHNFYSLRVDPDCSADVQRITKEISNLPKMSGFERLRKVS